MVITTAKLHSKKTELQFSADSNPLRCVGDLRWWDSLPMVPAGNKAKRLSSVNHSTKTTHHHHDNVKKHLVESLIYFLKRKKAPEDVAYPANCYFFRRRRNSLESILSVGKWCWKPSQDFSKCCHVVPSLCRINTYDKNFPAKLLVSYISGNLWLTQPTALTPIKVPTSKTSQGGNTLQNWPSLIKWSENPTF